MNLTLKQIDNFLSYIVKYKDNFGLSDYLIQLGQNLLKNSAIASSEVDIMEKEIIITLSEEFLELSDEKRKNVLIHELLHSKISSYNQKVREHTKIMEEHLVNDLTRGFERLLGEKDEFTN